MGSKYRTSSCRAKNTRDSTIGCQCGVGCDQPVPTYQEILDMQTDPLAFRRWLRDTLGKEKRQRRNEVNRVRRENNSEARLVFYLELVSKITDEESLKVLKETLLATDDESASALSFTRKNKEKKHAKA